MAWTYNHQNKSLTPTPRPEKQLNFKSLHVIRIQVFGVLYWSKVLTERFSIPYKNQTKDDTSL